MNRKMLSQTIGVLLIVLFIVGCTSSTQMQAPTPTLTLTINENNCTFDGPKTIPDGVFMIKLVIKEQKPTESGSALVTLEKGNRGIWAD